MSNSMDNIESIDEFLTLSNIYQTDFNTVVECRKKFQIYFLLYFQRPP